MTAPPAPSVGKVSETLKLGIDTGLGLVTVMRRTRDAPPSTMELPPTKVLAIVGWLIAVTLMLWLTAPILATAAPSLPVTAPLAMV